MPLATFGNDITTYSNAITAAEDGGKNAKAARAKAKKAVISDLKQLANYVENNCDDELAIFTTSGFTAQAKRSATGPVAVPTFKSLDYGIAIEWLKQWQHAQLTDQDAIVITRFKRAPVFLRRD